MPLRLSGGLRCAQRAVIEITSSRSRAPTLEALYVNSDPQLRLFPQTCRAAGGGAGRLPPLLSLFGGPPL